MVCHLFGIKLLGTNIAEIFIQTFSFKKMQLKLSSSEHHPFLWSLNVLILFSFRNQLRKNMAFPAISSGSTSTTSRPIIIFTFISLTYITMPREVVSSVPILSVMSLTTLRGTQISMLRKHLLLLSDPQKAFVRSSRKLDGYRSGIVYVTLVAITWTTILELYLQVAATDLKIRHSWRFHLRVPDLHMNCWDLTTRQGTGVVAPAKTSGKHTPLWL